MDQNADPVDAAGTALSLVAAFMVALLLTPVVRTVTSGLEDTLGKAWPFALTRCHVRATPGCRAAVPARLQVRR